MDFQIKSRDKYLKTFSGIFKKFDSNNDGLLNEQEFLGFMENLSSYTTYIQENLDRFLNTLDPYNHKNINFSDCVALFASVIYIIIEILGND